MSENPETCKLQHINSLADLCYKPAFQCLLFFKMNSRQENRSKFLFTTKIITRYSSERFLSISGQKMSVGFLKFCELVKPDTRSDHCLKQDATDRTLRRRDCGTN